MLTLRPRAARPISMPHPDRSGGTLGAGRSHPGARRQVERPPLWIMLSAVLVTLCELLPLLYLVARTLDTGENGWRFLLRSRTLEVVLNTAALVGAVVVSTIAIAGPLAWLTSRTDLPGRAFWSAAATLLLSPTGWDTLAVRVWTAANDAPYRDAATLALIPIAAAAMPMLLLAPRDRIRELAP